MRRPRYQPGPLVWCAIIAVTCLLLFLFQKILWLVVPFLLGLIIYYMLCPLQQKLVLRGMSHEASAALVAGGAFVAAAGAMALFVSWTAARVGSWNEVANRYFDGGVRFVVDSLMWLERNYSLAAKAHLSERLSSQLGELGEKLIGAYATDGAMLAAAWLPSMLLAPFMAFYFLADGGRFKKFLSHAVPNAFFERTLYLLDQIDHTARLYFQGLLKLTILDTFCLAMGLWIIGVSAPVLLGVVTAVLAWIPYVGSVLGCLLVVLVAATDYPGDPVIAYSAIILFVGVRLLDDFFFMPLTIGRSLKIHPLLTVLMIFIGGAVAGVSGLMLVLPVLGVVMVLGETAGELITDPRLRARHAFAKRLQHRQATRDLQA